VQSHAQHHASDLTGFTDIPGSVEVPRLKGRNKRWSPRPWILLDGYFYLHPYLLFSQQIQHYTHTEAYLDFSGALNDQNGISIFFCLQGLSICDVTYFANAFRTEQVPLEYGKNARADNNNYSLHQVDRCFIWIVLALSRSFFAIARFFSPFIAGLLYELTERNTLDTQVIQTSRIKFELLLIKERLNFGTSFAFLSLGDELE
jgi:hypothetical protein